MIMMLARRKDARGFNGFSPCPSVFLVGTAFLDASNYKAFSSASRTGGEGYDYRRIIAALLGPEALRIR